jgi:uncharacterized protein with HEPN domain/predicted nucleotidyltransferase
VAALTSNPLLSEPILDHARDLCPRFGIRQLDVFGSVLTDRFDPARSDVDLMVTFEDDAPARTLDGYFAVVDAFQTLFGRKVDLVDDKLVVNPHRRRSIDATRRRIFPARSMAPYEQPPVTTDRIPALLLDARMAAERIMRYVAGRTSDQYARDDMLRSGVERQFGIVGEALSAVRRLDAAVAARLPELPAIVAFRDILIHAKAAVDDQKVWNLTQQPLNYLIAELERLRGELTNGKPTED